MAKDTGMGMSITIDDSGGNPLDITNDINSCNWNTPRNLQDVTGLDKFAHERLVLLADFTITINGAGFNNSANRAHFVFKTVPSSQVLRTTTIEIPDATAVLAVETLYNDYTITRGADGGITWSSNGTIADGNTITYS